MRSSLIWHEATVTATRELSSSIREFEIQPEGGVVSWTPGSHVPLSLPLAGGPVVRHYSLVGRPSERAYRIAVKRVNSSRGGSRFMWDLAPGSTLQMGEPLNQFELGLAAPQVVLIAGGIGVTPLISMAHALHDRGAPVQMHYAAREPDDLVYRDELQRSLGPRLHTYCSQAGQRLDLDAVFATVAPQAQAWVCGPLTLLHAAQAAWARAGRASAGLHFETFGSGGAQAAQPFWVEVPRHGLRAQVSAERSLLDVLNEAGVETLSGCRRGECGLCALPVLQVQGSLDHRDVFLSAREQAQNQRLCACVSRATGCVVLDSAYRPD